MAVINLKSGRFAADWRDEFGKRHQDGNFTTHEAAQAFAALKQSQTATARVQLSQISEADRLLTISDAIDLYLTGKHIREATRRSQTATFAALRRQLGNLQLHTITPQLLAAFLNSRGLLVAPTTLAFEKRMIKSLFASLKEAALTHTNPAHNITGTTSNTTTARAITRDEELQLLTYASPRVLPRFLLAIDAGLRLREITGLRKNHVDFATQTIRVWASKVHRIRTLPVTGRLAEALQAHTDAIIRTHGMLEPDIKLFPLKRPDSFLWEFRQRLGWHFRFHDLRHTFAKRLHDAGASEIMIAAALGHSWRTTTDRYTVTHINQDDLRPAFRRMEELAIQHSNAKLAGVEVEASWDPPTQGR
jgi:integrase